MENENQNEAVPAVEEAEEATGSCETEHQNEDRKRMRAHLRNLARSTSEIARDFPEADLEKLFLDRRYLVLTSPYMGFSPLEAYMALYPERARQRIMRYTAKRCAMMYASSLQAGGMRPIENGLSAVASVPQESPVQSKEARAVLRERIKKAAALGKKIFPS